MAWKIEYLNEVQRDLENLDKPVKLQVLKAIVKVSENPLPQSEGGYGKALGNHQSSRLSGYFKIKLLKLGIRVVYGLVRNSDIMKVIVVSVRDDDAVYKMAEKRISEDK